MLTFKLMTTDAKIALSDKELELVCDTSWILTKHTVIQKVYALFGNVLEEMQKVADNSRVSLPAEFFAPSPKIAKGENYRLLPYVMLDYPRHFTNDDTLAIRTFFWWGHFFSVSLQLSGRYKDRAESVLPQYYERLQTGSFFICINDDPWEHDFSEQNFVAISQVTREAFSGMLQRKFVKIAKMLPVQEWNRAPGFIVNVFAELVDLLKTDQAPRR